MIWPLVWVWGVDNWEGEGVRERRTVGLKSKPN